MTRKSRREIERALDDLAESDTADAAELMVLHKDPDTGDLYADPKHPT